MLVSQPWLNACLDGSGLVMIDCTNLANWSDEHGMYRKPAGGIIGQMSAQTVAATLISQRRCSRAAIYMPGLQE